MGSLADHVLSGGTLPRTKMDLENILARNRGHAIIRVRLDAASPNHDGLYFVDEADAQVLVSRGWGVLEP